MTGHDGHNVMDCHAYSYALGLMEETQAPVVIKAGTIDGVPQCYVSGYLAASEDDARIIEMARTGDHDTRAKLSVGFLIRAGAEMRAIDENPDHPARG